jgi:hypothetical protein
MLLELALLHLLLLVNTGESRGMWAKYRRRDRAAVAERRRLFHKGPAISSGVDCWRSHDLAIPGPLPRQILLLLVLKLDPADEASI